MQNYKKKSKAARLWTFFFIFLCIMLVLEATAARAAKAATTIAASEAAATRTAFEASTTLVVTVTLATQLVATTLLTALRVEHLQHLLRSQHFAELLDILLLNLQALLHRSNLLLLAFEVLLDSCFCIFLRQFFLLVVATILLKALTLVLIGCEHFLLVGCVGFHKRLLCVVLQVEVLSHAICCASDAFGDCFLTLFCTHALLSADGGTAQKSQNCHDNCLFHFG